MPEVKEDQFTPYQLELLAIAMRVTVDQYRYFHEDVADGMEELLTQLELMVEKNA